jgi:hypothetical protein
MNNTLSEILSNLENQLEGAEFNAEWHHTKFKNAEKEIIKIKHMIDDLKSLGDK